MILINAVFKQTHIQHKAGSIFLSISTKESFTSFTSNDLFIGGIIFK